jgi:exodeoxyribonuclease III
VYTKKKPLAVQKGMGALRFDCEGRVLRLDFDRFTLLNIYFPNGQMNEERLKFKLDFYNESLKFFQKLKKEGRGLVICGDYNTAHKPIDLAHPKENEDTSGFLPIERAWLDKLVAHGFIDTFREFNQSPEQYSWWDLRTRSRERNIGWRIDYHFISESLRPQLKDAFILPGVMGSDHCPVGVLLKID